MHKLVSKKLDKIQRLFKEALGVDLEVIDHIKIELEPEDKFIYAVEFDEKLTLASPNLLYPYPVGTEYITSFDIKPLQLTLNFDLEELYISLYGTGRLQTGLCMSKVLDILLPVPQYAVAQLEVGLTKLELGGDDSFLFDEDFDLYDKDKTYRQTHNMPAVFPERFKMSA